MNVGEAAAAMLEREFPPLAAFRTAPSDRRGMLSRMNLLAKRYGSQKAAAAAAGVNDRTWRAWKSGRQKPAARSLEKLTQAADAISPTRYAQARRHLGPGTSVYVCAEIQWGGKADRYFNPARQRCTLLDSLDLRAIVAPWARGDLAALGVAFERAVSRSYYGGQRGGQWNAGGKILPIQFHGQNVTMELRVRGGAG